MKAFIDIMIVAFGLSLLIVVSETGPARVADPVEVVNETADAAPIPPGPVRTGRG